MSGQLKRKFLPHEVSEEKLKAEFAKLNQKTPTPPKSLEQLYRNFPTAFVAENFKKNRYSNVLPTEHTRVILGKGGYINANHIRVPVCDDCLHYIATQAPLLETVIDFWTMIWEQKTSVICMLTKLKEGNRKKADRYWPRRIGESLCYGPFEVSFRSHCSQNFIEIRVFQIRFNNETREVIQLHYTEWPDFGVPETTDVMRELMDLTVLYQTHGKLRGLDGPPIIHCSAGIGRAGTFLTALICKEQLEAGLSIEDLTPFQLIATLRRQRVGMVQTESQYIFLHKTISDMVQQNTSSNKKRQFSEKLISVDQLLNQPLAPLQPSCFVLG